MLQLESKISGRWAPLLAAAIAISLLLTVIDAPGQAPAIAPAATVEPNEPNAPAVTTLVAPKATDAIATLTLEELQARKKQAAESTELADEVKSKLAETYDKAIAQFKLAEELTAQRKQYNELAKTAPERMEEINKSRAQPAASASPNVPSDLTSAQAGQKLKQATLALEEAKKQAAALEEEPKRRAERSTAIPEKSREARQTIEETQKKLAALPEQGLSPALTEANRTLLQLQQRVAEARLAANTEELLFYDAAGDLLAAKRDLAARNVETLEKQETFWKEKVNALRDQAAQAAQQEAARAQAQALDAHPILQEAAKENADLAGEQKTLVQKIKDTSEEVTKIDDQLTSLEQDFTEMQDQVAKAEGVTNVLGVRLLAKRNTLPKTSENQRRIKNRPAQISQATFKWFEYDDRWSELSNVEARADAIVDKAETVAPAERDAIRSQLIEHLQTRRKTLKTLVDLSQEYATQLASLDAKERSFVSTVDDFANFIDANVLWVRTSHNLTVSDLRTTASALAWLARPTNWRTVGAALWNDLKSEVLIYALIALMAVAALVFGPHLHARMASISENIRQAQTDSFHLTVQAFVLTLALASMWPVILLMGYWRLSSVAADDFARALAEGLFRLVLTLFVFRFLQHLAMPHGLAQDHFRMRQEPLVFLRRHLRWFMALAVPVVLVLEMMHAQQISDTWYGTAGRLFFMVGMIGLTVFFAIVLRPAGPLVDSFLKQRRGGWIERLRYLWYPLFLLIPLVFAVLAGMGYVYGARHLNQRFALTIGLALGVLLVRALFVRGLVVAQRHLALLERQKRLAAAEQKDQDAQSSTSPTPGGETTETKAKQEPTIFEMSQQTRRLIGAVTTILLAVATWAIWNDVLPAFAKLGEHTLYHQITLGAVVTALVIVILTVITARNVPGLLEIVILRRLPIDRGVRFATITICRYVLVVVGIVLAFNSIGISWAKVQWLIAAMTVGLGFGLQEIFANFVSGLIILFEQPIRVDDIVTVGDVTGKVTMIKIRATTIRRWDQRELIVPNKEFITGQLINWTLTDSILRREFPVGIAYGSDIATAERLLYEIARNDPRVLADPAPMVLFKGFGSSSLDFELRVNYAGIENALPIWHDINVAIDTEFRKAKIEIAFPQHDLHLRSVDPDAPLRFIDERGG